MQIANTLLIYFQIPVYLFRQIPFYIRHQINFSNLFQVQFSELICFWHNDYLHLENGMFHKRTDACLYFFPHHFAQFASFSFISPLPPPEFN